MTQHFLKTMLITMAVALMFGTPALAGKDDVIKGGKSWIAEAINGNDATSTTAELTETSLTVSDPLAVVDSTGAVVGLIAKITRSLKAEGDRVSVGVRLDDGRVAHVMAFRNYLMGDAMLFSESADCSEPLYFKSGNKPNTRFLDRSGVANNTLYMEAPNGTYAGGNIQQNSAWSPSLKKCVAWTGRWTKSAIQVFPAKTLDYLPPYAME